MSVFDEIYRTNAWNGVESASGPGSGTAATSRTAAALLELVSRLNVRSVLDVGCGDGFWMPDLPGYVGADVSERAIALARKRHPDRDYIVLDAQTSFASFDLVLTRDAMQHLSLADGKALLDRIVESSPRWLLASTYSDGENVDVPSGSFYRLDLRAAPFSLGEPVETIFDGWPYDDAIGERDAGKWLALWPLSGLVRS